MNRKTLCIGLIVLLFALVSTIAIADNVLGAKEYQALPGNGFTYQGQLKQNGALTNNTCDFRFSLWTASSEGSQVGAAQLTTGVEVSDGYFSIPNLDFGDGAFNSEARWLEIEVMCVGEAAFTMLSPRQPITPTPYALALPGLYTRQDETSPNLIGGYHGNQVAEKVYGATIGGGGAEGSANQVTDHFSVVAGGSGNQAGNNDATMNNAHYATVSGGETNTAGNAYATVGGGRSNVAAGIGSFVGGGGNDGVAIDGNQALANASTIAGGLGNTITVTGTYAAIGGGIDNNADGIGSTVGGGESNSAGNSDATISGGKNNEAQGLAAVIGGGESNIVNGQYATVGGGQSNNANGDYSTIPGGFNAETSLYGQTALASGSFNENGDAQYATFILRNVTTNSTATELFLDGASARLTLAANRTLAFEIFIVGRRDAYSQSAGYTFRGVIKNDGGITAFTGSPAKFTLGEDNPAWDVTLLASDVADALIIQVSGAESATIRWVATVRAVEVAW